MSGRSSCRGQAKGAISEPCARLSAGRLPVPSAAPGDPLLALVFREIHLPPARLRVQKTHNQLLLWFHEGGDILKGDPGHRSLNCSYSGKRMSWLMGVDLENFIFSQELEPEPV